MYRILMVSLAALLFVLFASSASAQQVVSAFYDEGIFAYEDGNYQAAATAFQKVLDSNPEDPTANHFLGKTYVMMEQYEKAGKYIEKAWKLDAEMPDVAYDRAFLYYKLEKYGKAAALFKAVLKDEPSRVMAGFYCGVSLYRDRQYQQANPYLLAAAQKSPDLKVKAYYFSGLCHYYMDQQEQALNRLQYVKANTDSDEVQANAERWIQTIQADKQVGKPYKLDLRLAYQYDDNVPLEPTDKEDLYSEEEDSLIFSYAAGEYNLINQERLVLGAGISRFQTWHMELDEFNSNETGGKLYGRYKANPLSFGLQILASIYQLDEEDFLLTTKVNPTISYAINQQFSLWLAYTYTDKDYRQSDFDDRDGSDHEVLLDGVYTLKNEKGFLLGGIGYEDYTAEEDVYDYGRLKIKAGGSFQLPYKIRFGLLGSYWTKTYKEGSREDVRSNITLSLARELYWDWLEIAAEYTYTKNDSNESDFEYVRNLVGIGLIATF